MPQMEEKFLYWKNYIYLPICLFYLFPYFAGSGLAARTSEENKKREISFKQVPKSTFLRNLLSLVKKPF